MLARALQFVTYERQEEKRIDASPSHAYHYHMETM